MNFYEVKYRYQYEFNPLKTGLEYLICKLFRKDLWEKDIRTFTFSTYFAAKNEERCRELVCKRECEHTTHIYLKHLTALETFKYFTLEEIESGKEIIKSSGVDYRMKDL